MMTRFTLALLLAVSVIGAATAAPSRFDGPSTGRELAAQYNTSNGE